VKTINKQEKGDGGHSGEPGIGGRDGADYFDTRIYAETFSTTESKVVPTFLAITGSVLGSVAMPVAILAGSLAFKH
jgi:hypothetical protein